MPVARRRGDAAGLAGREASRVTSGCTASSRSRSSASSLTSSSCRRRPRLADRTSCCRPGRTRANGAWAGTRVSTPNSSAPHAPRSRNRARTRLANRRYPAVGPGVRRSGSRGSAIRKIIGWSPTLRGGWEPRWVNAISSRSPAPIAAGYRPAGIRRFRRNPASCGTSTLFSVALGWVRPFGARARVASSSPSEPRYQVSGSRTCALAG